jgi:transposase
LQAQQGEIVVENPGQYLTSFQRKLLLKNLESDLPPEYRRRIEIMLLADAGESQTAICKTLGCSPETARYWILMAQVGNVHYWHDRKIGRPKTINEEYLNRLKELATHSPREYGYPFQRWTAQWLGKHLGQEMGIKVSNTHINRLLKEMGLSLRCRSDTDNLAENIQNSGIQIIDLPSSSAPNALSKELICCT